MKRIKFLAGLVVLGLLFGLGIGTVHGEQNSVVIEKGDTLWDIAQSYEDVTVQDLLEWNPGIIPHTIPVGMEIKIAPKSNSEMPHQVYHVVKPGDTLYRIANDYEIELADLYELNPDIDPFYLRVGDAIQLRSLDVGEYHIVEPGDTYFSIANLYDNVVVRDLYRLNPNVDPFNLQIGSVVQISSEDDTKVYYVVRPGDTLFSISMTHPGVTLLDLLDLNPGINPYNLQIGADIRVN